MRTNQIPRILIALNIRPAVCTSRLKSSATARLQGDTAAQRAIFNDMGKVLKSEDAAEGVRSFLERDAATFGGR